MKLSASVIATLARGFLTSFIIAAASGCSEDSTAASSATPGGDAADSADAPDAISDQDADGSTGSESTGDEDADGSTGSESTDDEDADGSAGSDSTDDQDADGSTGSDSTDDQDADGSTGSDSTDDQDADGSVGSDSTDDQDADGSTGSDSTDGPDTSDGTGDADSSDADAGGGPDVIEPTFSKAVLSVEIGDYTKVSGFHFKVSYPATSFTAGPTASLLNTMAAASPTVKVGDGTVEVAASIADKTPNQFDGPAAIFQLDYPLAEGATVTLEQFSIAFANLTDIDDNLIENAKNTLTLTFE